VKIIEECGIEDKVYFTGMLRGRQRIEAYVDADLFALTSHQENFGITVIEAMASGLPVLISDQVNIHAQITEAGAGEVIGVSVSATTLALEKWMSDAAARRLAGERGRKFALDRYNWLTIAKAWQHNYTQIVA
jgi:glycosyltransferase involved in cell wall biosynthesis